MGHYVEKLGGIMVYGAPREVPRPKALGAAGPRVFCPGTSRGTPFVKIAPRLFHIMSCFCNPKLVKWDFSQSLDFLGSIMVFIQNMKPYILVELTPIILGRDRERMHNTQCGPYSVHYTL